MEQKPKEKIKKIKKISRALSIICKVLQWLIIPLFFIIAAIIIWQPLQPSSKYVVTLGGPLSEGSMSSAGPISPAESISPVVKLKLFSVVMTGNTLTQKVRIFLYIIISFNFFIFFKILHHLSRLFGNYAVGDIFSGKSIGQIKKIGFSLLLIGGLHLASLFLLVQNFRNIIFPESFQISGILIQLDSIVYGGLVIFISWVMDVGRGMQEENELTI